MFHLVVDLLHKKKVHGQEPVWPRKINSVCGVQLASIFIVKFSGIHAIIVIVLELSNLVASSQFCCIIYNNFLSVCTLNCMTVWRAGL